MTSIGEKLVLEVFFSSYAIGSPVSYQSIVKSHPRSIASD